MVKKRFPRVLGIRKKPKKNMPQLLKPEAHLLRNAREKTIKEKIYDIIYTASRQGYRFTDPYYGMPFIELEDIEEKENGIFVIRFRCEPQYLHHFYFGSMAEDVCKTLRSGMHFIHEYKTEWGLPYEECVWVLQVGEQDRDLPLWRKLFMAETVIKELSTGDRPHPRKCTHVRWDEFLKTHYNRSLLSVAQELGYSEQNLDILGGDFMNAAEKKRIYKKHKKLFDEFLADERNKRLMDGRKVYEYFKDLIASWIGEDLLVKALNEYGFNASVANADRDRVIKTNYIGVTGEPDIKIEYEGNIRYLELMDALSPVEEYGQFDMRLSKAKNQYTRKNLFLLHGLADGKYVLIDFMRDNVTVTYNYPNPRYGNKPCSVVRLQENGIQMHDIAIFWESLRDIMLNTKPEPLHHYLKMVDYSTGKVEMLGTDGSESKEDTHDELEEDSSGEDSISDENETESTGSETMEEQEAESFEQDEEQEGQEVAQPYQEESNSNDAEAIVEADDNGQSVEYTPEQWAALTEGF